MRIVDVVRKFCPRARPAYVAAFDAGDKLLSDYGLTTPLRLAHFLAQVFHETDGLTIERESGAYSAARLMEIFGVGRHSAAITAAEAQRLAKNGPAIFERVYGLGNPRKAAELGNTQPGDGWAYRGNGLMQTTGRGAHRRLGEKVGLGGLFEASPEQVTAEKYALLPALAEWKEAACNGLADKNDITSITRRINGGLNGFADRKSWFAKLYPYLKANGVPAAQPGAEDAAPAWQDAKPSPSTEEAQRLLNQVGYTLNVDGRDGPKTAAAVKDFQRRNGLRVDGVAGELTLAKIRARVAGNRADDDVVEKPLPGNPLSSGTVQGAAGAAVGGSVAVAQAVDAARDVAAVHDDAASYFSAGTVFGVVIGAVILAGGLYLLWSRLKAARRLPGWLGG